MGKVISKLFFIMIGAMIAALAIEGFLAPYKIIDGGVIGISMILDYILSQKFGGTYLGILTFCINLPFIILAFKKLGWKFVFYTFYAVAIFSVSTMVFAHLLHHQPLLHEMHNDLILISVFGGIILGTGVGLVLKNGGSLDGTEIVAVLTTKRLGFSVGEIVLFINLFIFTAAGFVLGWIQGLYSILTYYVAAKVIDLVIDGFNESKAVRIITTEPEKVGHALIEDMKLGITYFEGKGGYTGNDKTMIYCVVSKLELVKLKDTVNNIDSSAFMAIGNVYEVVGGRINKSKI